MARPPTPKTVTKTVTQHGQNIFIYNHIRTNQVIYSLTRTLNNTHSLKQLPPLGKNTTPPRLRKDLWTPLAHIHFPSPPTGLLAYRRLLEYRRLHETAYPLSLITQPPGTPHAGQLMSRKSRARVLMDQKANAVADVAAVLGMQERSQEGVRGVRIGWVELRDAEFAGAWPEGVVHGGLGKSRYTAAVPAAGGPGEEEVGGL